MSRISPRLAFWTRHDSSTWLRGWHAGCLRPGLALSGLYYGGLTLCLQARSGTVRTGGIGLVAVTTLLIVGGPVGLPGRGMGCRGGGEMMQVVFLDVDQADATLVILPSGRSLLVDAGGSLRGGFDVGSRIIAPVLWNAGVRRLDYLAVTHAHPDHIGGAVSVTETFRPREIWEGVRCRFPQR